MLSRISWKNVWRNKVRSLVVICSIALGVWAGTFIMAFSTGMVEQYVNIAIQGQISHIQLHNPDFKKDKKLTYTINDSKELLQKIDAIPEVKAATARTIATGMASSAETGAGATIYGIIPGDENRVTGMRKNITDGTYFKEGERNPVVIGQKLAKKLNVKLKNKIILTFQDINGNLTAGAFRVSGIYKTKDDGFDESNIFINRSDLDRLLNLPEGQTHEIAVLLKSDEDTTLVNVQQKIKALAPGLLVENWKEIAPDLQFILSSLEQKMLVIIVIILLALAFGIINTMLMAVLERVRELGILMAIGMNKPRVFFMIMIETVYLSLVGGPLGLLLAYATNTWFGHKGIDLSIVGKGLSSYGMDTMVYPSLPFHEYITILMLVLASALLSAIYPSIKALQLKPVDAIRKI